MAGCRATLLQVDVPPWLVPVSFWLVLLSFMVAGGCIPVPGAGILLAGVVVLPGGWCAPHLHACVGLHGWPLRSPSSCVCGFMACRCSPMLQASAEPRGLRPHIAAGHPGQGFNLTQQLGGAST